MNLKRLLFFSIALTAIIYVGLMVLVVYAADVSNAFLSAVVTVTETTGSAQSNVGAAVPLNTQGLIDGGIVNSTTSNMILCEEGTACPTANELPMMPSPIRTRVEGAHRDDGGSFTSETTDSNDLGTDDITFFVGAGAINDAFYVLADHQFTIISFNVGRAGASTDIALAWEYYNGASYVAVSGLTDGTVSFTKAGLNTVSWDPASDMAEDTINGTTGFSVRARVTAGTYTTYALGTQVWYEPGVMWVFNDSLAANQAQNYTLFVGGQTEMATSHAMFLGTPGVTTLDAAGLEAGARAIEWEIRGFFNSTATGANDFLVSKGTAIQVAKDSVTDGRITTHVEKGLDDCDLGVTAISSALHTFRITLDAGAGTCRFFIDGVEADSDSHGASAVPDNATVWRWADAGAFLYVDYVRYTRSGTLVVHYEPRSPSAAIVITDRAGASQDGTPSWRAFPTGNTASIASFVTTDPATTEAVEAVSGSAVGIVAPTAAFASTSSAVVGLPGGQFISTVAAEANLPAEFYWLIIAGFLSLAAFVGVQLTMRNLWWSVVAGGVVLTAFSAPTVGIWSVWAIMFYGIMSGLVLIVGDRFQASGG